MTKVAVLQICPGVDPQKNADDMARPALGAAGSGLQAGSKAA